MGLSRSKKSIKTFLGLSSFQILAMFRRGLFYTYLSIYMREFLLLSVTVTTLYATLPMIMSVIFQNLVWGPISDKFQKRRTLIILGEILAGIGTILVWFIHFGFNNFFLAGIVIIIGLTCIEAFWSMSNIGWSALLSDIYPSQKRSRIMGQLTSIGGFGRIIGVTIGGYLYDNGFGFRNGALFFIASFIMFISTIPMFIAPEGGINKIIESNSKIEGNNDNGKIKITYVFIVFIISLIFINFGRNSIATTYSQYLVLDSGFNVDSIMLGYIANSRSFAVIIIGIFAGVLSRKLGNSKTLILGIILSITALIVTALTSSLLLIYLGSVFIGAGEVIITASSYTIASNLIPEKVRAKLFGVYNATFFLSWGLACTIISGPIIDFLIINGSGEIFAYQTSFIVAAIITAIGLILFIAMKFWMRIRKN